MVSPPFHSITNQPSHNRIRFSQNRIRLAYFKLYLPRTYGVELYRQRHKVNVREKDSLWVSGQPYGLGHQDDVEMELRNHGRRTECFSRASKWR
jgi:hypothetical protein